MSNEITAYFKGRTGVAESVYQYDYGMVIVFDNIELPATFDCYFSNEGDEESTPVIGADNRAAIPNRCLSVPGNITIHIPTQTGLNDSEVEYVVTVKVINRARPTDGGTEEEQSAISQAIAALNHNNLPGLVPDIVTDWLDDHPEATTTVQDDSLTTAKYKDESVTKDKIETIITDTIWSEPINVLLLGVKNDGSEDCSDIINEATQTHELYFPKGKYRIDNPIYVEKSIYGAGALRDYRSRSSSAPMAGTCLWSNIDASSADNVGVLTVIKGGADIIGLSIMCNADEDGINFHPTIEAESIKIQNVTVFGLGDAAGIRIIPDNRCSRAAYIDNCSIFGKGADSSSTGIYFGSTAVDSLVNNCEIMAVQVGIVNYAQIRVSNTHIWTGILGSQTVDPWWSLTKGFDVHSELYTENAYIDTAFLSVCINTKSQVRMYNTLIWNDNSINESARYDQTVFYCGSEYANYALLSIKGLTLCDRGRVANLLSSSLMQHVGTNISDVHIISDKPNEPSNYVMGVVGRLYTDDEFAEAVNSGQLIEVANIAGRYGGTADIEVTMDNAKALIRYNRGYANVFTITAINGTINAYYKSYSDANSNTCYKLYIHNTGSSSQRVFVKRRCTGNATMTSYLNSTVTNWDRILPETLSSTSGLTQITAS